MGQRSARDHHVGMENRSLYGPCDPQPPPPYTPPPPSQPDPPRQVRQQSRLDRTIAEITPNRATATLETRLEAEKLRQFLIYVLVVDYGASTLLSLPGDLHRHFLQLGYHMADYCNYRDAATPEERALLSAYFTKHVFQPADLLGIPAVNIFERLQQYRQNLCTTHVYQGAVSSTLRDKGILSLAWKFKTDVDILIPRLIPPFDFLRGALLRRADETRQLYFHEIRDDSSSVRTLDEELRRIGRLTYRQTEWMDQYEKAQQQGRVLAGPYARAANGLDRLVRDCLKRMRKVC